MRMWTLNRAGFGPVLAATLAISAQAAEVSTDGGITVTSDDGNFSAQIGGRLQTDVVFYNEDVTPLDDGTEVRRARIFVKGRVYGDWEYKLETDFAGNETEITDAYLKHEPTGFVFGQFKVPFTLEQLTSSRFIPFMERAADGLREGRRLGIGWSRNGANWTFGTSVFGQAIGEDTQGDEGLGGAARLVYRPWQKENGDLVHLGVSGYWQEPTDETHTLRLRDRPWSHVTGVRFVDTGLMQNVDYETGIGAEFSSVFGSFSAQAEYIQVDAKRLMGFSDEQVATWYAYGTWMSKGSRRSYDPKAGTYKRSKVKPGTWELGLRYSETDLNGDTVHGGRQEAWTVGANYYVNPKLRFMGNFVAVDTANSEVTRGGERENIDIVQFRMSFDF